MCYGVIVSVSFLCAYSSIWKVKFKRSIKHHQANRSSTKKARKQENKNFGDDFLQHPPPPWINTENIHPLPVSVIYQQIWIQSEPGISFQTIMSRQPPARIDIWGSWPNLNLQCMYVDLLTCWLVCFGWVLDLSFQIYNFASTLSKSSIVCTFVVPIPIQPLGHHYHSHHDIDMRTLIFFFGFNDFLSAMLYSVLDRS